MEDSKNTSIEGIQTGTEGTRERTFTQDDVNRIVSERLAKEKSKASNSEEFEKKNAELETRAEELKAKENRLNALGTLRDAGYPDELADVIRCSNADELKKTMEVIDKIIKERTPEGWTKDAEARRSKIVGASIHSHSLPNDEGIRSAMGLRG